MIQALVDRYYHAAYERIWAGVDPSDQAAVDEALIRTERAWDKAVARIQRETGYSL